MVSSLSDGCIPALVTQHPRLKVSGASCLCLNTEEHFAHSLVPV